VECFLACLNTTLRPVQTQAYSKRCNSDQGGQMIWKKITHFFFKVAQGIAILGYFFNEPTKSSLIVEKLLNLVTLSDTNLPIFSSQHCLL
jgi:hypothetical protein